MEQNKIENILPAPENQDPKSGGKKEKKGKPSFLNSRKLKHGSLATVITLIFVAVVVLVNVVFTTLTERFPLKLDLTENSTFHLTEDSISYLKELDVPVKITVLYDEKTLSGLGTEGKQITEIVNQYKQYGSKITVAYMDKDKNPEVIAQYSESYKGDLTSKMIVVEANDRIKALSSGDLISYQTNQSTGERRTISTAEQSMTSAIMAVTDADPKKITVLSTIDALGDMSGFTSMLSNNGYEVEEMNPNEGDWDPDTDVLVINSPEADYSKELIDRLDVFLDNDGQLGKHLIYVAAYNQKTTPNLDSFLEEYGLRVEEGYVMDSNQYNLAVISSNMFGVYATPANETFTKDMAKATLPVMVPLARPVTRLFEGKDNRTTESILATADTGYIVDSSITEDTTVQDVPKQACDVMARGYKLNYEGTTAHISSVLVVGSPLILHNTFLSSTSLNNADYMLNVINKITGKETGISILPKDLTTTTIDITAGQVRNLTILVMYAIPIAIMAVGVVIWFRRRHR